MEVTQFLEERPCNTTETFHHDLGIRNPERHKTNWKYENFIRWRKLHLELGPRRPKRHKKIIWPDSQISLAPISHDSTSLLQQTHITSQGLTVICGWNMGWRMPLAHKRVGTEFCSWLWMDRSTTQGIHGLSSNNSPGECNQKQAFWLFTLYGKKK